jgi:hypothetical protein
MHYSLTEPYNLPSDNSFKLEATPHTRIVINKLIFSCWALNVASVHQVYTVMYLKRSTNLL